MGGGGVYGELTYLGTTKYCLLNLYSLLINSILCQNGTFIATEEPMLVTSNHPWFIASYLGVHSCCCTFYGSGQMFDDVHHYSIIKSILTVLKIPTFYLLILSQTLATIDLSILTVLPFLEGHEVQIIECIAFSISLLHFIICI